MTETEKFTFKGWQFIEWLKGNKEAIKLIVSAAAGFIAPVDPQWQVLVGALTKFVLDSIDYWLKE